MRYKWDKAVETTVILFPLLTTAMKIKYFKWQGTTFYHYTVDVPYTV